LYNIFTDVKRFREEIKLDFPIDPNKISGLSVLLSLLIPFLMLRGSILETTTVLFIVLLLDLLDGAIARGRKMDSRKGQITDWTSDRISEVIIFVPLALIYQPLIFLAVLNIFLNFLVLRNKLVVLPLRHILLIVLFYMVIF